MLVHAFWEGEQTSHEDWFCIDQYAWNEERARSNMYLAVAKYLNDALAFWANQAAPCRCIHLGSGRKIVSKIVSKVLRVRIRIASGMLESSCDVCSAGDERKGKFNFPCFVHVLILDFLLLLFNTHIYYFSMKRVQSQKGQGGVKAFLSSVFLPQRFPNSVSPDYLVYQVYIYIYI